MAYFKDFPPILFKLGKNEEVVVQDFIRAVRVDPTLKTNPMFYLISRVMDDETPEMLSFKFYGSPHYHWVIMILNERFDPYQDFPKSDKVLRKFCEAKYDNMNAVHHWVNSDGHQVDEFTEVKFPVTNYEFEVARNDDLRQIKILRTEILSEFVGAYKQAIKQ